MDTYTFLPWTRKGLGNQITQSANARSRASLVASVRLSDGERTAPSVSQDFLMTGPGDITGLDPDAIVRVEPKNWITDFEPNYLPFVEFYEEDFPWRFTPRGPQGSGNTKLIPWLTVLVLKEDEFTRNRIPGRPLTSVIVKAGNPASLFPPANQLWAWAHTQIIGNLGNGDVPDIAALNSTLDNAPDSGLSRIVSPRKLDPEEAYHAFVIPTFNVGRMAGLGIAFDDDTSSGLELSWENAGEFPIYHEWYFRTGERGDFEELARRMIPRVIPPRVGIRDMDISDPDFGMPKLANDNKHNVVGLEGALKSPQTIPEPHQDGSNFPSDVSEIINQPAIAEANGAADPVVAPPIYGRWHALVNLVDPAPARRGWVDNLNRDARFRTAAGLGAEVIRRNQEGYMKLAWEQVGEVLIANRKIALAQAAAMANKKLLGKTLEASLDPSQVVAIAGTLNKRLKVNEKTLRSDLSDSRVTSATLSGSMRKMTRMRGALEKRLGNGGRPVGAAGQPSRIGVVTELLNQAKLTTASQPGAISVVTLEDGLSFLETRPRDHGPVTPTGPVVRPGPIVTTRPGRLGVPTLPIDRGPLTSGPVFGLPDSPVSPGGRNIGGLFTPTRPITRPADPIVSGLAIAIDRRVIDEEVIADSVVNTTHFDGIGFSKDTILNVKVDPSFRVTPPPGSTAIAKDFDQIGKTRSVQLQKSFADFSNLLNLSLPNAPERQPIDIAKAHSKILETLQPDRAFRRKLEARITMGDFQLDRFGGSIVDTLRERIIPAMACPDFKDPMYKHLTKLGDEFLVPNLGLVSPNTISLMLTNPKFIEAYMVGLNHEFSSELLFREYPTDQRCSAFRQFWDVASIPIKPGQDITSQAEALKDILPIHTWGRASVLGTNSPRTANHSDGAAQPRVVLVIRGDLLRKYPNTIIYAQSARFGIGDRKNELILYDENGAHAAADITDPDIHFPTFKAQVSPDLHFIGFDLTLDEVRGHPDLEETAAARNSIATTDLGKYFVIQEVVGETRFGLDVSIPTQPSDEQWDNLSWQNIDLSSGPIVNVTKPFASAPPGTDTTGLNWGANAADMASILYQKPAMLAIHGKEMLKDL